MVWYRIKCIGCNEWFTVGSFEVVADPEADLLHVCSRCRKTSDTFPYSTNRSC